MAFGIKQRQQENKPLPTRYYSHKQETTVAQKLNGKITPNSGATAFGGKGDVVLPSSNGNTFLCECKTKTTNSESISIKREWFEKNKAEMVADGKDHQVLIFNFGPDAPYNENHYVIDEYLFIELQNYLNNK